MFGKSLKGKCKSEQLNICVFSIFCRNANNLIHQNVKVRNFSLIFIFMTCTYVEKILCGEKGSVFNNAMFEINNYDLTILRNTSLHCCKIIKSWCTKIGHVVIVNVLLE